MSRSVLIINSSSRIDGNTDYVLSKYKELLERHAFSVEYMYLSQMSIQSCLGCRVCFDKGEGQCPLKDDVALIANKLAASQLIILGSPIYVEDINGILKNWIDRMAFNCHRPHCFGKDAYVVCTSGMGTSNHGIQTMTRAVSAWGYKVIGKAKYTTGARINIAAFEEKYSRTMRNEIRKIEAELNKACKKVSFMSLVYFKVQQKSYQRLKNRESFDYAYWLQKGWLNKNCNYFLEIKISKIKILLANILVPVILNVFLK